MTAKQPNIILVMIVCLVSLNLISSVYASVPEKEVVLKSCARLFGAPLDGQQNLFEVNRAFVLQAKFSKGGKLQEFAVKPKYFFNETHPEWTEPYSFPTLSQSEFQDLVMRLDGMKAKGDMVKPRNNISVVTNSTGYYKETYKHAVLEWGELADRSGVRFFSISYRKS